MVRSIWYVLLVFALVFSVSACQPIMSENVVMAQSASDEGTLEAVRAASAHFPEV